VREVIHIKRRVSAKMTTGNMAKGKIQRSQEVNDMASSGPARHCLAILGGVSARSQKPPSGESCEWIPGHDARQLRCSNDSLKASQTKVKPDRQRTAEDRETASRSENANCALARKAQVRNSK